MLCNPKHEDRFDRLTEEVRRAPAVTANLFSKALIELELPAWKVRHLICEDGIWLCSLSRQPNMPIEFDDTADAYHEVLPLAILGAFVEARRRASVIREVLQTVPRIRVTSGHTVCCDNFS